MSPNEIALIESIHGHLEPCQVTILYDLAAALPDNSIILEIGAFRGKSTACLGLACLGTSKIVYSIDPFKKQPTPEYSDSIWDYSLQEWQANMERVGISHITKPIVGLSSDVAPQWNKPINMLFIDGAHVYADVLADFNNYFKWLVIDGTLAMHDVMDGLPWLGVLRVWNENAKPHLTRVHYSSSLAIGYKTKLD